MRNLPLSEWIKTVEDKKKPIMVYDRACKPMTVRANLKSFKAWFASKVVVYGAEANLKVHKVFDIPGDSYQVYLTE